MNSREKKQKQVVLKKSKGKQSIPSAETGMSILEINRIFHCRSKLKWFQVYTREENTDQTHTDQRFLTSPIVSPDRRSHTTIRVNT